MSTLTNFPMMSQLADTTEVNRQFDCVPTCIAASLQYLLDKPYDAASIKDAVYGKEYTGGTAAQAYIAYCAAQGVKLFSEQRNPGSLVMKIHQYLALGSPCIITEPDPYAPSSYGWTHVLVSYSDESGYITFLDPYPGKAVKKSDQEWQQLLLNNQIWILQKKGVEDVIIDLSMPVIAAHFEQLDADHWQCRETGKVMQYGILDWYRTCGAKPYCGFSVVGLPKSNEQPLQGKAVRQFFERGVVVYDPDNLYGKPEGSGDVYLLQLYSDGPGTDPAIAQLQQDIADLKATSADPALVASLQGKIADAQKALA